MGRVVRAVYITYVAYARSNLQPSILRETGRPKIPAQVNSVRRRQSLTASGLAIFLQSQSRER